MRGLLIFSCSPEVVGVSTEVEGLERVQLKNKRRQTMSRSISAVPSYSSFNTSRKQASAAAGSSPTKSRRRGKVERQTLKLSQVLRQVPSSVEPNKISVVEKNITEVDPIPDKFLDVDILYLSNNSINSLTGFRQVLNVHVRSLWLTVRMQFRRLRVLSVACNCIESFSELQVLQDIPQLQVCCRYER